MSDGVQNNIEQPSGDQQASGVDYESKAREQGWVAKEEYRGDESNWVDAQTFVQRGEQIMPILRKNNEKLLKELKEARAVAEEARNTAKEFQKFQKEQYERKARELEQELVTLKQAKRDAVSSGDGDRLVDIDEQIDAVKADQAAARAEASKAIETPPPQQTVEPTLQNWLDKNEWFGVDARTTGIANGLGEAIRRENPSLVGKAFLDKLDEELASVLPQKFGKTRPTNPMDSTGSNSGAGRPAKAKKSYENLPADAQAACDRFLKQGLIKSKEDYVANYDWSE